MKGLGTILAAISLMINSIAFVGADGSSTLNAPRSAHSIQWLSSYQEALSQAQRDNKFVLLFFTGSDWCSWCGRLEQEVLSRPEFADAMSDRFVFVKVDYPAGQKPPKSIMDQNQQLKKRYSINSFPTLVIIDNKEHVIGQTGYREGGPVRFAQHLRSIIDR